MIIFLYGPDSYRRNEKLKELTSAYRTKHQETDILLLDLEESPEDWIRARDFLVQPSMFVESKVLIIKESGEPEGKEWQKVLKNEKETQKTFIFISDKAKPKKAFSFLLEKPVQSQEMPELKGKQLENFLRHETGKRKLILEGDARDYFCRFLENAPERSWLAVNELDKILVSGFPKPISLANLKKIISFESREEVFALARKILAASEAGKRIPVLEEALFAGDAAYVFNSLAYQSIGRTALRLAEYDERIKSGRGDYEEALFGFAIGN